jgi:hypothetical protein
MAEQLPAYSGPEACCPKCGAPNTPQAYCDGRNYRRYIEPYCPWVEHFHRRCQQCSYLWMEAVLPQREPTHADD